MWIRNISKIMYYKCKDEDKYIYRKNISDDFWVYMYCSYIKDRKEMWNRIKDEKFIFLYCRYVENRTELAEKLTKKYYIDLYEKRVKGRESIERTNFNEFIEVWPEKKNK